MAHGSDSGCRNGGCTSQVVYRGKYCFRCWAGVKWTSIVQRLENKTGHCNSYVGIPIDFTREELISWVLNNPPPKDMQKPSIDRIIPELGYTKGNIRWLEFRKNASGPNRDLPDGYRRCAICAVVKLATNEFFPFGKSGRFSSYCKPCNRVYQHNWELKRETRHARI